MRRLLITVACVVALLGGLTRSAHAATPTTLVVDTVVAVRTDTNQSVNARPYGNWSGVGISVAGAELWTFTMSITDCPTFYTCRGIWQLSSVNHSGDILRGSMHVAQCGAPPFYADSGQGFGRFAGLTTSGPQQFDQVAQDCLGIPGVFGALPIYSGSFRFNLS